MNKNINRKENYSLLKYSLRNSSKIIFIILFSISSIFHYFNMYCNLGSLSNLLKMEIESNTFISVLEKQLSIMQEDKKKLEENLTEIKIKLTNANKNLKIGKDKLEIGSLEKEFINQKNSFLSQTVQVLTESENTIVQIIGLIDNHSKILNEYKLDPEFKNKNLTLPIKSLYTFSDLSSINDQLIEHESELKELEEKAKKITADLSNRQKTQSLATQEYNDKKRQQNEFSSKKDIEIEGFFNFNTIQKGELLDYEVNLFKYKKDLEDLKIKEFEQKRNFLIDTKIKINKIQIAILQQEYSRVRKNLQVDIETKKNTDLNYEKDVQESDTKQKAYKDAINGLNNSQEVVESELNLYKKQFNINANDLKSITEWQKKADSIYNWQTILTLQKVISKIEAIKIHKSQLEAQMDLEKIKLYKSEIINKIVNTWYNITTDKYNSSQILNKETKIYESIKSDLQAKQTSITEKKSHANINLSNNSKLLDNIKLMMQEVKDQQKNIFLHYPTEYSLCMTKLKEYQDDILLRGEPLTRILEFYSQSYDILNKANQKIERVIIELDSQISKKTGPAIFWQSLKDFVPHFIKFIMQLKVMWSNYFLNLSIPSICSIIDYFSNNFYEIIYLILQTIIFLLIFILIKLYMNDFINVLQSISPEYGLGNVVGNLIVSILKFIHLNLFNLFLWLLCFLAIKYIFVKYLFIKATFLLFSIPYLLWNARKLITYLTTGSKENHGYTNLQKIYQKRFILILRFFSYATVTIFLLKESFLTINTEQTSVPTILSALNFIILQACLIFLVGRDQILNLIPQKTSLWQKIYEIINKYYYLLLTITLFFIFMSNPYIGYGGYFFKISSKIILIGLLIAIFSLIQGQIKKLSTIIFFQFDGEIMKDRFSSGKTLYGVFIITSFIILLAITIIISLNIIGYSITFNDIIESLSQELYSSGLDATGRRVIITPIDFIKSIAYVAFGFIIAYVINNFLLTKMFELLMVNIGTQNVLSSLSRYALVIISIVIGLNAIGLGASIIYIGSAIAGIGIAAKELIADGIAYFIILIQRPIKVGDFIMFDEDTKGVVRRITPRSVIIRRKNSVTVMIPNYYVMTKSLINWSSSRTFFAFDDIILTLPYSCDPSIAKELILKVLTNNINILRNPAPIILLREFTEIGFQFLVRGFLSPDKVLEQFDIASDLRLEIVKELRNNNIDFAIPSRVIFENKALKQNNFET